jgi:hypothetical protein
MTFPTLVTDFLTARAARTAADRRAMRAALLASFTPPAPRPCVCARCSDRAA